MLLLQGRIQGVYTVNVTYECVLLCAYPNQPQSNFDSLLLGAAILLYQMNVHEQPKRLLLQTKCTSSKGGRVSSATSIIARLVYQSPPVRAVSIDIGRTRRRYGERLV